MRLAAVPASAAVPAHLRADAAGAAILLAALAATYANSFAGGFQFDDFNVIVRESSVQSLRAWWRTQPSIRPLLKLSHAVNHAAGWGLAGFHAVNLAIHAVNTLLVWWLLRLLAPAVAVDARAQRLAALAGAAVFALHPVQTEAVTYVSGRSTSLAGAFALASLTLWLHGRERGDARLVHLASPLALAAALACKEYAVVTPVAMLLCARLRGEAGAWRDVRVHALVVALLLAGACAVPRYRALLEASLVAREPAVQLLTQARALSYLALQLVRIHALNADPALAAAERLDAATAWQLLGWVALPVAALQGWRRHPLLSFALLWYMLWLAPTHSILPRLDVVNERQLYLALAGPAFAGVVLLLRHAPALIAAVPVLLVLLALATWQRNAVYADEVTYWADAASKSTHNARAFANLGHALALACRRDEALQALDIALALDPQQHRAAINRGLLAAGEGQVGHCMR
jgi:tetratricopeptide (TPR) repeat protein